MKTEMKDQHIIHGLIGTIKKSNNYIKASFVHNKKVVLFVGLLH
jgi:hypothetical protein